MKIFLTKKAFVSFVILSILAIVSCNKFKNSTIQEAYLEASIPVYDQLLSEQQNAEIHLGRVLFYDKNLSKNNSISCASCHKQALAFADNTSFSSGFENRMTKRNSIAIQNLNSNLINIDPIFIKAQLFWDGRESSLFSLISKPIANHVEMGIDNEKTLIDKLNQLPYMKNLVENAYGSNEVLTMDHLSNSITQFLSQIKTNSNFDLRMTMNAPNNLTALEQRGEQLFNSTYECSNCHHPAPGSYVSDGFVNIGLDASDGDKGRMNVSNASQDEGAFKIPDLHNVTLTAPYMHDGRFATLNDVLEHYSHGIQETKNLDPRLRTIDGTPLKMNITSEDKTALIAFLGSMTDYSLITNPLFSNPFKLR